MNDMTVCGSTNTNGMSIACDRLSHAPQAVCVCVCVCTDVCVCVCVCSVVMFYLTAPCVPHHIETYIECEDSLGSVSWTESDGAEFYTAIAVGLDGHIHTCVSNSSTCSWDDLHCGDS